MKTLLIIAQKGFQDKEYFPSKEAIEKAGIEVTTASVTTDVAIGKFGENVKPDITIANANASDYDAIVIIGGPGAPELANHLEIFKLLKEADEQEKIIAAICIAPIILAKAGLLKMKKATIWNGDGMQSVFIEREGAIYTNEAVVVDNRIITADGPDSATAFGEKIAEILKD